MWGRHPTSQSTFRLAVITVAAVFLALGAVRPVKAYAHIPVVHYFALKPYGANTKSVAARACGLAGGYLSSEPTVPAHDASDAAAASLGRSWYAYLGADNSESRGPGRQECPPGYRAMFALDYAEYIKTFKGFFNPLTCYYRWNEGRWRQMQDDTTLDFFVAGVGVSFYRGNAIPEASPGIYGPVGSFPSFFERRGDRAKVRPGPLTGGQVLSVGEDGRSIWSDNEPSVGYSYANFNFTSGMFPDENAIATSGEHFIALCNVQAPTRDRNELTDTSSDLQDYWWVAFFTLLFLLCFIAFVAIVSCQEREDMDEPPEDVPAWALSEADKVVHTRSLVGHRSLRTHDEDRETVRLEDDTGRTRSVVGMDDFLEFSLPFDQDETATRYSLHNS